MKHYELTFIIDAQLAPEKQEEVIAKFLDLLKSLNVEVLNVEKWGKKKLSYAIGDRQYGYYLMTQFKATSNVLPQIDHHLKLSPFVFRHLLLYRDARTLKMMKLESERLAREAMYDAEKERVPAAADEDDKPDGGAAIESPAEEKKQAPAADADAKPEGDTAIETPAEDKERASAMDADTKPDGDVTVESPADNTEEHQEEEGLEDTGPAEKE